MWKYITGIAHTKSQWINEDSVFLLPSLSFLLQVMINASSLCLLPVHWFGEWSKLFQLKGKNFFFSCFFWFIPHNLIKINLRLKSVKDNTVSIKNSWVFNGDWGILTVAPQRGSDTCPYLHKCVQCEDVLPSNIVELDHGTLQKRAVGKVTELGLPFHTSNCQEVSLCAPLGHHLWNHKENGQHEDRSIPELLLR